MKTQNWEGPILEEKIKWSFMWGTVKVAEVYWKMLLNFSSLTTEAAGHEATVMTEDLNIYSKIHRCTIPNLVAVNIALTKVEAYVLFTCI